MLFDLTPESLQRRRLFRRKVVWPRVAAALVLLAGGVGGFALHQHHAYQERRLERYQEQKREYDQQMAVYDQRRQQHDGLLTDLRGIAARIFGGRDLLYLIRVLKEKAPRELWVTQLRTAEISQGEEERGRQRGRGPRSGSAARGGADDTAIDRGRVVITGKVKPLGPTSELHRHFNQWYQAIADWRPPGSQTPLFRDARMLRADFMTGDDQSGREDKPFVVQFDFHPTELSEVLNQGSVPREGRGGF